MKNSVSLDMENPRLLIGGKQKGWTHRDVTSGGILRMARIQANKHCLNPWNNPDHDHVSPFHLSFLENQPS